MAIQKNKTMVYGQSLAEYGLLIGLVALGAIGGLTMLGSRLADTVSPAGVHISGGAPSSGSSASTGSPGTTVNVSTGINSPAIQTQLGSSLTLANYPNLSNAVETAGVNGATKLILGQMESLIAQLETSGEIDSQQAQILHDLANQGHRIAGIEAMLESHISQGNKKFSPITFEGKTYSAFDLSMLIAIADVPSGGHPKDLARIDLMNTVSSVGSESLETQKFLDLYNQAKQSGALADPATAQWVGLMGNQIMQMANIVQEATHYEDMNHFVKDNVASNVTNASSVQICHAGQGQDAGTACTP